jgi:hypothetical protein
MVDPTTETRTAIFNGKAILEKCIVCAKHVELYDLPQKFDEYPIGHFPIDGSYLALHHPLHLECAWKIQRITNKCPFCCLPNECSVVIQLQAGQGGGTLQLSLMNNLFWQHTMKEPLTSLSASSLLEAIESDNLPEDPEKLKKMIDDALHNPEWNLYGTALLFAVSYQRLSVVIQLVERPNLPPVDQNIITAALEYAKKGENKEILKYLMNHFPTLPLGDGIGKNSTTQDIEIKTTYLDGYPLTSSIELPFHLVTRGSKWDKLTNLLNAENSHLISAPYLTRAWQKAAAGGNSRMLERIALHPSAAFLYKDRIEALILAPDITALNDQILPLQEYPDLKAEPTLCSSALDALEQTKKMNKLAHGIQYTQRFYPDQLQNWLNHPNRAKTVALLNILIEQKISVSSTVRGEFLVALIGSQSSTLQPTKVLKILSQNSEGQSEKMLNPSNPNFAPISRSHMTLALLQAAKDQNLESMRLLFDVAHFPLTGEEWKEIYGAAKEGEDPTSQVIALLEEIYPEHSGKASRASLQQKIKEELSDPPLRRVRPSFSDRLAGCQKFFSWIGSWITRGWAKVCACWRPT